MNDISQKSLINKDFQKQIKKNESLIACDDCDFKWSWKDTILYEAEYESSDKNRYYVTAFNCSQCGKEYIIAVNNEITFSEIREIRRIEKSMDSIRTIANGEPTPKQVSDIESLFEQHRRVLTRIVKHQKQLKEYFLKFKSDLVFIRNVE